MLAEHDVAVHVTSGCLLAIDVLVRHPVEEERREAAWGEETGRTRQALPLLPWSNGGLSGTSKKASTEALRHNNGRRRSRGF